MIEVKGLTKYYGEVKAIEDVTFEVKKGEILGFLGPNGAGKTTTMRIITGFLMPQKGKAYVGGYDVEKEPLEVKKLVGYLPETPPVYPDMTVKEYLYFVAELNGVNSSNRYEAVSMAVEKCGLKDVYRRLIGNLSRGYKQRVGIAQAIVHSPEVLVLDEPTIGLDPAQVKEIRDLIKELGKEHTIILSTHILPEVTLTCNRVIIINEGRLIAADTYESLTKRVADERVIQITLENEIENIDDLKSISGVAEVEKFSSGEIRIKTEKGSSPQPEIIEKIVAMKGRILEVRSTLPTLEEVYLKLISTETGRIQ